MLSGGAEGPPPGHPLAGYYQPQALMARPGARRGLRLGFAGYSRPPTLPIGRAARAHRDGDRLSHAALSACAVTRIRVRWQPLTGSLRGKRRDLPGAAFFLPRLMGGPHWLSLPVSTPAPRPTEVPVSERRESHDAATC
jgi:hypothetical protein